MISDRDAGTVRLLADIGATNARFALENGDGEIGQARVYACADYSGVIDAVQQYLKDTSPRRVRYAAMAIAHPVDGDQVRMTNRDWSFSIEATRQSLGFDTLLVVNDFTALAMAIPKLNDAHWRQIGAGASRKNGPIAVLGPGTGLGVSGLLNEGDRWIPLASEGGHVTFSPVDVRDDAVLSYARQKWPHVSFERVAAGPGLSLIYDALAARHGLAAKSWAPEKVVDLAQHQDELAIETIVCFCGILGTLAGNLALTLGAKGGVYIGGGVVPKLGALFDAETFRRRFEQKGRFEAMLKTVPTYLITAEHPAFFGVSAMLSEQLSRSRLQK